MLKIFYCTSFLNGGRLGGAKTPGNNGVNGFPLPEGKGPASPGNP
jgi:hypothetical protein